MPTRAPCAATSVIRSEICSSQAELDGANCLTRAAASTPLVDSKCERDNSLRLRFPGGGGRVGRNRLCWAGGTPAAAGGEARRFPTSLPPPTPQAPWHPKGGRTLPPPALSLCPVAGGSPATSPPLQTAQIAIGVSPAGGPQQKTTCWVRDWRHNTQPKASEGRAPGDARPLFGLSLTLRKVRTPFQPGQAALARIMGSAAWLGPWGCLARGECRVQDIRALMEPGRGGGAPPRHAMCCGLASRPSPPNLPARRWVVSFVPSARAQGPSSSPTTPTARAPPSSAPSTLLSATATSRAWSRRFSMTPAAARPWPRCAWGGASERAGAGAPGGSGEAVASGGVGWLPGAACGGALLLRMCVWGRQ